MRGVFLVSLLLVSALAGDVASSVKPLTPATFDEAVNENNVMVKFFAPWCGHCKHLAPDYMKVAESFKDSKKVIVAEVDCDAEANKALCSKNGVTGYPTLKFFPKGQPKADVKYEGARTAEAIQAFISEKTGERAHVPAKAYVELTDASFDQVVMNPEMNVLVAFYAPWCGHCQHMAPEYEKAAASFIPSDKVVMAKLDADHYKDLATKYGVTGFPTIKFFAAGKKEPEEYNGAREAQAFVDFLNEKSGAKRLLGGALMPTAGRVEDLDEVAKKFREADPATRRDLLKDAQAKVASMEDMMTSWSGKFYVKTMENVATKGKEYIEKEKMRLQKIIDSKAVAAQKLDEMAKRIHILEAF
ncbi:putative Protein disulfide-isomerase 1 [Paratrimastix pyriformis]|uniref:protein disulfide-isomerase n=1 Tax=Paratrimastix pyriformis TaxID=342808 RepID=A0ABQ8UI21_9EUKA|nr:putative Protein disulfide-isomerase 1 [Paratrimastix pyriformis]|eukprot:GAFH01002359.1.p2 GENE.GAFH01002359.1~~GAFH01002359.1.p2  ORF type:complete len:358 (+),score=172.40 GAFH01002359.1:15-1088(+)